MVWRRPINAGPAQTANWDARIVVHELPFSVLRPRLITAVLAVVAFTPLRLVDGQTEFISREYELKAKLVRALAAYIEPEGGRIDPEIKILVIGKRPTQLKTAQETLRRLGTKDVVWDPQSTSPDIHEVPDEGTWDIIYLLKGESHDIDRQLEQLTEDKRIQDNPTLIITEQTDSFRKTAAINLFVDQAANQLRVQVRKSQLREHHLKPKDALFKAPGILEYD